MKKKVEIIGKSTFKICKKCEGKGCKACVEGIFIDENFIIVAEDKNGKKIAFSSDQAGK